MARRSGLSGSARWTQRLGQVDSFGLARARWARHGSVSSSSAPSRTSRSNPLLAAASALTAAAATTRCCAITRRDTACWLELFSLLGVLGEVGWLARHPGRDVPHRRMRRAATADARRGARRRAARCTLGRTPGHGDGLALRRPDGTAAAAEEAAPSGDDCGLGRRNVRTHGPAAGASPARLRHSGGRGGGCGDAGGVKLGW